MIASRFEVAGSLFAGIVGVLKLDLHDSVEALGRRDSQVLVKRDDPVFPASWRVEFAAEVLESVIGEARID